MNKPSIALSGAVCMILICGWSGFILLITGSNCLVSSGADNNRGLTDGDGGFTMQHAEKDAPVGDVVAKIYGQVERCAECSQR